MTLPRRRRFNAVSKVLTRSSASSSISISLSRITRNPPWSRVAKPGYRRSRNIRMTSSINTNRTSSPGRLTKRSSCPGYRHQGVELAVLLPIEHLQRQAEPAIGEEREWMRRVDGERRQDREDLTDECALQPFAVGLVELIGIDHRDADLTQFQAQRLPAGLLIIHQLADHGVDLGELLRRRQPVGARRLDAHADLRLQPGDADHVELVQIAGRNRQEPDPFQASGWLGFLASSSTR